MLGSGCLAKNGSFHKDMIWFLIAWRNFTRTLRRSVFTVSIVAIGAIAALVTLGYIKATFLLIKEGVIHGGVGHFQIAHQGEFDGYAEFPLQHGLTGEEVKQIVRAVSEQPTVKQLIPRLYFQGLLSSGERSLIFVGQGIDAKAERKLSQALTNTVAGHGLEYEKDDNPYKIVIGIDLARQLGLEPGSTATLMGVTIHGGLNAVDTEVVGLADSGNTETNKLLLYTPMELAQNFLLTDKISRLVVQLENTADLSRTITHLAPKLANFALRDWRELTPFYGQLFGLYVRQFSVLGIILAIVVILTMSNSIAMSFYERKKAIATLSSIGLPTSSIRLSFLYQGGLLSLFSSVVGVVVAYVIIGLLNSAQIEMPPPPGGNTGYPLTLAFDSFYAAWILCLSTFLGAVTGWITAYRITASNLVESLRYE